MDAPHFTGQVSKSNRYEILIPYEPEPRITHKWCYRCRSFKPYDEFYKKTCHYDGYSGECKLCDGAVRTETRSRRAKIS